LVSFLHILWIHLSLHLAADSINNRKTFYTYRWCGVAHVHMCDVINGIYGAVFQVESGTWIWPVGRGAVGLGSIVLSCSGQWEGVLYCLVVGSILRSISHLLNNLSISHLLSTICL
jgi:hypothetical protein